MKMMMLRTGCISYSSLGDGKGSFVGRKTGTLFTQVRTYRENKNLIRSAENDVLRGTYIDDLNYPVFSPPFFEREASAAGMGHDMPSYRLWKRESQKRLEPSMAGIPSLDLARRTWLHLGST